MTELDELTGMLMRGATSRRDFLGRVAALATATALPAALVLPSAARAEPKRGGKIRFGMSDGSATDSLDPGLWPGSFAQCALGGAMCNNLTEILSDGSIVGDIAESFEAADNSSRWVFKIRSGVTFHNGKSLTEDDVIQSIQHHMGKDSKSAAKSLLEQIAEIKVDGPNSVQFKLNGPSPDFPYMMADYHLPILPAKSGGGIDISAPMGTGAFVMQSYVPGISAKLSRNPNYHKENKPYLDEVEFIPILDVTARANALMTGEIDFMQDCDLKTLGLLKRRNEIKIQDIASTRHFTFDMNTQLEPFNNPDVRRAIKYAFPRDEIIEKIFLGTARVGNDNNVASSMKFFAETPPQYAYDPAKAKELLKKAGLETVTVDLSVAEGGFPGATDAAVLFKARAEPAGVMVNIVREADDGYWSKIFLQKPFYAVEWYGRATVDWLYSTTMIDGAPWNTTKFKNARFEELYVAARSETDDGKKAAIYAEMQQIVHDDGGMLTVAFLSYLNAVSEKVGYGDVGGIYPGDNTRMAERWWVEEA